MIDSSTPFAERVLGLVRSVPDGRVTTYGAVAALAGAPRAARGVGAVLSGMIESDVPWWRVVNRHGSLTIPADLGLRALQRARLEDESVTFDADGRVRLDLHGWPGPGESAADGTVAVPPVEVD